MFILWRERPITSGRKVELFGRYYDHRPPGQGRPVRRKFHNQDLADWKSRPIYCLHRGPGRFALTPQLMLCERVDGRPRRRLLHTFATLRTCCRDDPVMLAMWWHDVGETIGGWEEWDSEISRLLVRDRRAVLARLREVAPRPCRKGKDLFKAYRLEREAEAERLRQEERQAFERECARRAEQERRRQEEQARRNAEQRRAREEWQRMLDEMERQYGGRGGPAADPCWEVLGLHPTATAEQVKSAYRGLAMKHHPDRGGEPADFIRVQRAYERALNILGVG